MTPGAVTARTPNEPGHGPARMLVGTESESLGNSQRMSDTSQGPGWWLASDGRWYPPEAWTGPPRMEDPLTAPSFPVYPGYPGYQSAPYAPQSRTNGMAVASLVCACTGIIPFFFGITCILGIVFGFVARGQIKNSSGAQQGSGLALAGIIVGFSLIGLFLLLVILAAAIGGFHSCTGTGINSVNCNG